MSLNGMHPVRSPAFANGSQLVLNFLPLAASNALASVTQPPAPCEIKAFAMDGLTPPGRKKLTSPAETQVGSRGSQGTLPLPTASGLVVSVTPEFGSAKAALQFATVRSP